MQLRSGASLRCNYSTHSTGFVAPYSPFHFCIYIEARLTSNFGAPPIPQLPDLQDF